MGSHCSSADSSAPFIYCDQIRRNFATLAKLKKSFAILLIVYTERNEVQCAFTETWNLSNKNLLVSLAVSEESFFGVRSRTTRDLPFSRSRSRSLRDLSRSLELESSVFFDAFDDVLPPTPRPFCFACTDASKRFLRSSSFLSSSFFSSWTTRRR